jgi:general secretion pathway protein D
MNNLSKQMRLNRQAKSGKIKSSVLLALLMLQLSACETISNLRPDAHVNNRLENPKKAVEVPQKIENVNAREAHIQGLLANAELAWNKEDFDALNTIYTELEAYDPGNLRAREGLIRVQFAQKHLALIAEAEGLIGTDDDLAMNKLHQVLLENPQHYKALPLYNSLLQAQDDRAKAKLKKTLSFNKPVTMEFRDVSLKQIFEALSKTTNINFILDKDMPSEQKATIFVKSMAFKDAFDLLLQSNQLEKKVLSDNSVIIYVNDILHQRDYKDLIVRSYTLDYADAKQLSIILRSMLNIKQIEIDPRLNTLILKDSAEVLALAEKMIQAQDFPDAEVMLEVQVMEIKSSYLQNLGVNPPTGISVPVPSSGILTIKDLKVSGNSLVVNGVPGLVFNAKDGNVSLLANPRIRVKNKEIAKIHIGEKVPVFTSNVASTGVSSQTVQYIDAGLKLEVEPQISTTGDVTIKLNLNVGSIGDKVVANTGTSESVAFRVGTRLTSTVLRLHDGETQILAGLIDDQDRKNVGGIPGLSKIPLLGKLFSSQTDDKVKTEIVLSITPRIIRDRRIPTTNQSEMWIGSEGQAGRGSPSPKFINGVSPFLIPKPPPAAAPAAMPKEDKPPSLNMPLPDGFSLGNGLQPAIKPPDAKPADMRPNDMNMME